MEILKKVSKAAMKKMVIFDPDELNAYEHYEGKKQVEICKNKLQELRKNQNELQKQGKQPKPIDFNKVQ